RGMAPGGAAWFLVGALLVVVFPWLLMQTRPWFERWVLSRRDFARILTLLVALRAVEVARIPRSPRAQLVSLGRVARPARGGAGAGLSGLAPAAPPLMLPGAAWSREP